MMDPSVIYEAMSQQQQQHSSVMPPDDHATQRPSSENLGGCVPLETLIDNLYKRKGTPEVRIVFNKSIRRYFVKHEPPDTTNMQDINLLASKDRECAPCSEGDKDCLGLEAIFKKSFTFKHAKFDICGQPRRTSTV
jgi:hypothetical protein